MFRFLASLLRARRFRRSLAVTWRPDTRPYASLDDGQLARLILATRVDLARIVSHNPYNLHAHKGFMGSCDQLDAMMREERLRGSRVTALTFRQFRDRAA